MAVTSGCGIPEVLTSSRLRMLSGCHLGWFASPAGQMPSAQMAQSWGSPLLATRRRARRDPGHRPSPDGCHFRMWNTGSADLFATPHVEWLPLGMVRKPGGPDAKCPDGPVVGESATATRRRARRDPGHRPSPDGCHFRMWNTGSADLFATPHVEWLPLGMVRKPGGPDAKCPDGPVVGESATWATRRRARGDPGSAPQLRWLVTFGCGIPEVLTSSRLRMLSALPLAMVRKPGGPDAKCPDGPVVGESATGPPDSPGR